MTDDRKRLEDVFYSKVPNARRMDPFFRTIFAFMYDARERAGHAATLNIYMSGDMSGEREEVYRTHFFDRCQLTSIDFQQDAFVYEGKRSEPRHRLPFPDDSFEVVVTTKYIMEHVTEPADVLAEIRRVLKPGGEAFIVAAHVRRQHQKPYDFYRFTEFSLDYLAKKVGFSSWDIQPTDGGLYTLGMYSYFFQRSIVMPKVIEKLFDFLWKRVTTPISFILHRLDKGYGRDFSSYFTLRAVK